MEYLRLRLSPGSPDTFLRKIIRNTLGLLVPKANPDFEGRYWEVVEWWLESDEDNQVTREIGFDASGNPIAGAPLGVNWGLFVHEVRPASLVRELERTTIDQALFEQSWTRLETEWTARWERR